MTEFVEPEKPSLHESAMVLAMLRLKLFDFLGGLSLKRLARAKQREDSELLLSGGIRSQL